MVVPFDYDTAPDRYRTGMRSTREYAAASLYDRVALVLTRLGVGQVLDVGCADGALHAALPPDGPWLVGLDASMGLLRDHPASAVQATATRLPFRDQTFDALTALNVLYHLHDPLPAIREAHRVLRPGGHLFAATIARDDSPELAAYWNRPATSFDAEDAPGMIGTVFDAVTTDRWDAPLVTLPSPAAIRNYLLGRQAPAAIADAASRELPIPLSVTKRGALIHGQRAKHSTAVS